MKGIGGKGAKYDLNLYLAYFKNSFLIIFGYGKERIWWL
jgi:hypothetical protein